MPAHHLNIVLYDAANVIDPQVISRTRKGERLRTADDQFGGSRSFRNKNVWWSIVADDDVGVRVWL